MIHLEIKRLSVYYSIGNGSLHVVSPVIGETGHRSPPFERVTSARWAFGTPDAGTSETWP